MIKSVINRVPFSAWFPKINAFTTCILICLSFFLNVHLARASRLKNFEERKGNRSSTLNEKSRQLQKTSKKKKRKRRFIVNPRDHKYTIATWSNNTFGRWHSGGEDYTSRLTRSEVIYVPAELMSIRLARWHVGSKFLDVRGKKRTGNRMSQSSVQDEMWVTAVKRCETACFTTCDIATYSTYDTCKTFTDRVGTRLGHWCFNHWYI